MVLVGSEWTAQVSKSQITKAHQEPTSMFQFMSESMLTFGQLESGISKDTPVELGADDSILPMEAPIFLIRVGQFRAQNLPPKSVIKCFLWASLEVMYPPGPRSQSSQCVRLSYSARSPPSWNCHVSAKKSSHKMRLKNRQKREFGLERGPCHFMCMYKLYWIVWC